MISIRPSSCQNEYYLGDKPGTLQYNLNQDVILNCFGCDVNDNIHSGYILCDKNDECLIEKLIPYTKKGRQTKWKLICAMKRQDGETIWLKGALLNIETNKIALMTSTNNEILVKRPIKSHKEGWVIGHYRMSAPSIFWHNVAVNLYQILKYINL